MRGYFLTLTLGTIACLGLSTKGQAALPPIEAKSYELAPKKTSTSKRVVLFDSPADGAPIERKILLLRKDGQNTMAFRVVKIFPDRNEFAATRVREYRDIRELELQAVYKAYEKVGDLAPLPSPEEQKLDDADLKEFEETASTPSTSSSPPPPSPPDDEFTPPATQDADLDGPIDDELDSEESPSQSADLDSEIPGIPQNLMVREELVYDPDSTAMGPEFAYFRSLSGFYFVAGGLRYSYMFSRSVPMGGAPQTNWSLDLGAHLYRVSNYVRTAIDEDTTDEDSFSLLPLGASLRYTIMYSPDIGVFFYAGAMYSVIVGSFIGTEDETALEKFDQAAAELGTLNVMGGVGLIYRFGPRWNLRADAGWDRIGVSVMLRF